MSSRDRGSSVLPWKSHSDTRKVRRKKEPPPPQRAQKAHQAPCEGFQLRRLSVGNLEFIQKGKLHCHTCNIAIYSKEFGHHLKSKAQRLYAPTAATLALPDPRQSLAHGE